MLFTTENVKIYLVFVYKLFKFAFFDHLKAYKNKPKSAPKYE